KLPDFDASAVWWAVRRSKARREDQLPRGPFGISLVLRSPTRFNLAGKVKPLLDGVIAALHVHDGSELSAVTQRLAQRLKLEEPKVAKELMNSRLDVLGPRNLVRPYRTYLQWNP